MTIMLTGASGFVGRKYIDSLNPYSHPVVAIDLYAPNVSSQLPVTAVSCDLCNKNAVIDLIDTYKPSTIIHMAAISDVGREDALKLNVSMANNIFHAIVEIYKDDKPKLILAGSAAEYGDVKEDEVPPDEFGLLNPLEPYAESKVIISRVAHAYRRNFDIPITILRFANIYGPRQETTKLVPRLVKAAVEGDTITLNGQGTPTRQWIYIDDVILAIDAALRHMEGTLGAVYNIGNPSEVSLKAMARMVMQITHDMMLTRGEMPIPAKLELKHTSGGAQRVAMDMSLAKRVLAFTPLIRLSTGLTRTIHTFLADRDEIRALADSRRNFADPPNLLGP